MSSHPAGLRTGSPFMRLRAVAGSSGLPWTRVAMPRWLGASLGPFAFAALAALVLLLVLGQVLRHAVEQGDERRRATATHWQATWKCQALRERAPRLSCLARLRGTPPAGVAQPRGE
jgi:hypothetical protein